MDKREDQALSPVLLVAQKKLALLRQKRRNERIELGLPIFTDVDGRSLHPPPTDNKDNKETDHEEYSDRSLPAHLGWESETFTAVLRSTPPRQTSSEEQADEHPSPWLIRVPLTQSYPPAPTSTAADDPLQNETIKLYPDMALGMLKEEQAAPARIWLILQYLDKTRCGQITIRSAREKITGQESPWRICCWRQLRNLLAQGEGVFWRRENGRIWLRSTEKVAIALQVHQLTGLPVAIPVAVLKQSIGVVRAHFYASFHSGRTSDNNSEEPNKPISRTAIEVISDVSRRSQQNYEKRAGVRRRQNFAVGELVSTAGEQSRAWEKGQALFRFTDHKGRQGKTGVTYLAWQLPNQYFGPHSQCPKGRQKRINQNLTDLFMKGMTGNGGKLGDDGLHGRKRFYGNGISAIKAYNCSPQDDVYWQDRQHQTSKYQVWRVLSGKEQL